MERRTTRRMVNSIDACSHAGLAQSWRLMTCRCHFLGEGTVMEARVFSLLLALGIAANLVLSPSVAESAGAISINYRTGQIGWCSEQATENFARTCAEKKCEGDCNEVVQFSNACIAFIYDRKGNKVAWNYGRTQREAMYSAIESCRLYGGIECEVDLSFCDWK